MIAEADAEIEAGSLINEAAVDAWIDSLGTDHERPVSQSPSLSHRQFAA